MNNSNPSNNSRFPIRELSARTQVNTVTLRAWERRYGLLQPERTLKGHRLYSVADVATIERVLSLVARGVPLSKVKPLLMTSTPLDAQQQGEDSWQGLVAEFIAAIELFSVTKVEHMIKQTLANYPVPVCRARWLKPVFAELTLRKDHGAALGFAESELMRYACLRLKSTRPSNQRATSVTLIVGKQTPIWRLALLALELDDAKFSVYLLHRAFSLAAGIELAWQWPDAYTVFYQDGIWNSQEQAQAGSALLENKRLFMCGTAPGLMQTDYQERVFTELKGCLDSLYKEQFAG